MFRDLEELEQEFECADEHKTSSVGLLLQAGFSVSNLSLIKNRKIKLVARRGSLRLKRAKCRRCGVGFVSAKPRSAHNQRYCSKKCYGIARNNRNKPQHEECVQCGRRFARQTKSLCSRICRTKWVNACRNRKMGEEMKDPPGLKT